MPFVASSYNYATPLSSAPGLLSGTTIVADIKYFTLFDNALDGSYYPISGDVGIWSDSVSDANGVLSTPFVLTVTENAHINAFRLTSSQYSYPVAFTVEFYADSTLLHTITETANTAHEYLKYLPSTLDVTKYVITVTKISQGNAVARLYSTGEAGYAKRVDATSVKLLESSKVYSLHHFNRSDVIRVVVSERISHVHNRINPTRDTLNVKHIEVPQLTNVHTRMKDIHRHIYGKVYVTYTDPMLDDETSVESNSVAYNSIPDQVLDNTRSADSLLFTLYDNDLSGKYHVMSESSQVGWVSDVISGYDGTFVYSDILGEAILGNIILGAEETAVTEPYLQINFSSRPITQLELFFDEAHNSIARDFTVEFLIDDGTSIVKQFVDNSASSVTVNEETIANVHGLRITVTRTLHPMRPAVLLEVPVLSTILYQGMDDYSDLMSIDMLEELTYDDDIEALGGISANETTVVFNNYANSFYFNNAASSIAKHLKRNRKIVPWLGTEIKPGLIEWHQLGVFWSYRWNVPVNSLTATVTAFDTIGLLDTTDYYNHNVQVNKSIGELIDYVLSDAKTSLDFLEWRVDPALYDIVIPYAWFERASHSAALRKITTAYPMHIYCDRQGVICAAPQKLHLDYYYDTWSDSTNVISKEYSSLHTVLPNIMDIAIKLPTVKTEQLVSDNLEFYVDNTPARTLNFSSPCVGSLVVDVSSEATVGYTYTAYSWGIEFTFYGSGLVYSISCTGNTLDTSASSSVTYRNEESIRADGAVKREVSSDFIQTSEQARVIMDRMLELAKYDRYDASVAYRGDIALSINDPIRMLDGIAPDDRYNIRRHQLTWNGALTGSADINT